MRARQREMLEVALAVPGDVSDPFDPRVVAVDARVRCPSGRTLALACFWGQAHERTLDGGRERWVPAGPAGFFLRLAPEEIGRHEGEIVRTDAAGARVVMTFTMDVTPSDARGAVRVAGEPRRLVRDDGSPGTPIGMNLCWWVSPDPSVQMDRVLGRMAAAGMTWVRLWLTHYGDGFTPEWDAGHPSGHYEGLGRYSLAVGARLDHFFAEAGRLGIDVQLVLWQHAQLASPSHSAWDDNPYNAARGGPCRTSAEFFTHPEAIRLSDQRLRMLVARYGAYPSLFAWEVFNEMDLVMDAPLETVAGWCADRVRTLRALDAHRHLVTTSQAFPPSLIPPVAAGEPLYDLVQCHVYAEDLPDALAREAAALARCGKPSLAAEVGLGPGGELDRAHPDGRHLHHATWAALAAGLAGGAMSWWWDSAVDAHGWYGTQTGAARFVAAVDVQELGTPTDAMRVEGAPGARVIARSGPEGALAWIQNPTPSNLQNPTPSNLQNPSPPKGERGRGEGSEGVTLIIPGLAESTWQVDQWDTATGQPIRSTTLRAEGEELRIEVAPFDRDTAVTVRRSQ